MRINTSKSFYCFYIVVVLLCVSPFHGLSQGAGKPDTASINKMFEGFPDLANLDPSKGMALAKKGMALSQEINYTKGIIRSYQSLGYVYGLMGDLKNSLINFNMSLKIAQSNRFPDLECVTYANMSRFYADFGGVDLSYDMLNKAIVIARTLNRKQTLAMLLTNMSFLLSGEKKFDEANKYCLEALTLQKELRDTAKQSVLLSSIGGNYLDQKKFPEAFNYLSQSLKLAKTSVALGNMGTYYATLDNQDSALYYFYQAREIIFRDSDIVYFAVCFNNIGTSLLEKGDYVKAEQILKQSGAIAKNLHDNESLQTSNKQLADLYSRKNDFKNAYKYQLEYDRLKDTMENLEKEKKFEELNVIFDVKETEAKNNALSQQNELQRLLLQRKNALFYGSLAALVALIIIAILLLRQSRLKADQQRAELEQKQLRAQMNPHFIFNCLNSIQHFVVANDVRNANKYLTGFAQLMRQTLENSKEGTITLRREIAYLENYLALELMRFEDRFTFEITCNKNVSIDSVEIPSMIIQPFIENAIRHGLCYLTGRQGRLSIKFYMQDGHLICEIDDNGIGMEESKKIKMASDLVYESQGMALTRQRLALVSKTNGSGYQIAITNKKNAQGESEGTTVLIKFPGMS